MIAHKHGGAFKYPLVHQLGLLIREDLFVGDRPDPLDLFFDIRKRRHIMGAMTGRDAVGALVALPAFSQIDRHAPPFDWRTWNGHPISRPGF